jgi:hypothetical protein
VIPLATTTITVSALENSDLDGEPYSGEPGRYQTRHSEVRAVIDPPEGPRQQEQVRGGEQNITDQHLSCDPIDLQRLDRVTDDMTGFEYRVMWVWTIPGDHTEAGLRLVQGEV